MGRRRDVPDGNVVHEFMTTRSQAGSGDVAPQATPVSCCRKERTITPVATCDRQLDLKADESANREPRGLALRRCERERLHGQGP
jgi:hypothetical protein